VSVVRQLGTQYVEYKCGCVEVRDWALHDDNRPGYGSDRERYTGRLGRECAIHGYLRFRAARGEPKT
jgi:hypothetical protein